MGPAALSQVLRQLPKSEDPNLLVGLDTSDDAAVYKMSEEMALIQTIDFFTPVVDDPYLFGQVSAANALSDIYAMGGSPLLALNIVCFPDCLPREVLLQILLGGADKVREAGAVIAGGHTVSDDEPKYGLAVTGLVHPKEVITNAGARPGDLLVLTKPLGTGIISTALKADMIMEEVYGKFVASMVALNREPSLVMKEAGAHACTDVTGFGLLGHAAEMAQASGVSLILHQGEIPLLPQVGDLAAMGIIPAGAYNNRDYLEDKVVFDPGITQAEQAILFDPQTSGGLFIAVRAEKAGMLVNRLSRHGAGEARVVGQVIKRDGVLINVRK